MLTTCLPRKNACVNVRSSSNTRANAPAKFNNPRPFGTAIDAIATNPQSVTTIANAPFDHYS